MRSSVVVLTFFGAAVLAHPSVKHRHLQKRDETMTTTVGNKVIVEEFQDVTLPPGGQVPSSSPVAQEKVASPPGGNPQWSQHHQRPQPSLSSVQSQVSVPVQTSAALPSTTPVASPIQPSEVTPSQPSSTTAAAPVSSTSAATSPVASGTFWAQSPKSPLSGGTGSKDVLTQANYWRQKWLSLPPFTWSSTLANNSYETTTQPTYYKTDEKTGKQVAHNEGGAMVMGHELYPGSSAQCIITGDGTTMNQDLTPFEVAFLGWLCELPNDNIPCAQIGAGKGGGETGHADIIKGSSTQIGCYYMDSVGNSGYKGMWTCDFAG